MDYLSNLHKIEQALLILDDASYNTVEEANECLIKYDKLKDDVILIVKHALDDFNCSILTQVCVYNKAIQILTNYIGSADDIQKYESILESFHNDGKITKKQLDSFYNNLNIGRWR